jgi:hypothetical protein
MISDKYLDCAICSKEDCRSLEKSTTVGGQKSARFSHFTAKLDLLTPLTLNKILKNMPFYILEEFNTIL